MGSGGRIGRMISYGWSQMLPSDWNFIRQGRAAGWPTNSGSLQWDPADGVAALCKWVDLFGPVDAMLVLSGVVPSRGSDLSQNSKIAEACLEGAAAAGIERVLLTSSSAVYGAYQERPFRETDSTQPVNAYGQEKLNMEAVGQSYNSESVEVCALRIGNVTGADALLINRANATLASPLKIDCFADGTGPLRSYIGPMTLARVCETLTTTPRSLPAVINVAALAPVRMEALASAAAIPWAYKAAPSTSYQHITLDCSRLARLHPFEENAHTATKQVSELQVMDI